MRLHSLFLACAVTFCAGAEPAPAPDIEAAAVIRRVTERARAVAAATNAPPFVFRKLALYETLAADGPVRRSREKIYEVSLRRGMTQNRLIAVDGRQLAADESTAMSDGERKWRDSYAAGPGGSPFDRMDALMNERLFARFEFQVEGRETIRGHRCVVLSFHPRAGDLPEDRLIDRLINLLRGRIWVEESEAEIARAEVRTEGQLRLWGGILGSLEAFELHLDRERSSTAVWFNRHIDAMLQARKLFSAFRVRVREFGSEPSTPGAALDGIPRIVSERDPFATPAAPPQ